MSSLLPELSRFAPTYTHLIIAALLPIYTASHSSLRRPANTLTLSEARALLPKSSSDSSNYPSDDDEEELSSRPKAETLTAQDAMMFPVTAGVLLGTLYLIIKYLDDPTLLSRLLTWYFCFMGIFAVGKACADVMLLGVGFLLPDAWTDGEGRRWVAGYSGWKLESNEEGEGEQVRCNVESPIPLIKTGGECLWKIRRMARATWQVKLTAGEEKVVKNLWIGDVLGPIFGALVVAAYALGGKHWLLTNIMGISFSYGALQLLSPTTFPIATLLLGLLFFYDIFFVFYTPLMVTVATNLDVPIKLLFPRPGTTSTGAPALAMLGLGDVVIPGLVVAMALRFDLWRHYEFRRQALLTAAATGKDKLTSEEEKKYKPAFFKPSGLLAAKYWNNGQTPIGSFSKPYFTAAMGGYVVGMVATLLVMHVWKHAQPALLYLVPGVLGAVWGTAAVKGEVGVMWAYTEEAEGKVDEETAKKEEEEAKKQAEEKEKREKEEEERLGEKERVWLDLKIVRKPALGAGRRKVMKGKVEEEVEVSKVMRRESTGIKVEEESELSDSGSDESSEVVDVAKDRDEMWGTTVIGSDG